LCDRQDDELQLHLRVGSEDVRSIASMSQPSLHLTLDTQTQDMTGDCIAELPPALDAAARLPADDAIPAAAAAADAPLQADAAQHAAPTAPHESTEQQFPPSSAARGSSGESEGEEPPEQHSDSDEEAISGASDAAPDGSRSSNSSSSDSESDHEDDAQVRRESVTKME
jgi:hypothetical protein